MESFRIYKELEISYRELSHALSLLGFHDESTQAEYRYVHSESGCVVRLPLRAPNHKVVKAFFASYSFSLYYFGITEDVHDLAKLIEKERFAQERHAIAA